MRKLLDLRGLSVFIFITITVFFISQLSTLFCYVLFYSIILTIQFIMSFIVNKYKNVYRIIPGILLISAMLYVSLNQNGTSGNLPIFVAILIFLLPILLISLDLQSSISKLLNKKTYVIVLMFMVFFYYPFGIWYFQKILNQISVKIYQTAE